MRIFFGCLKLALLMICSVVLTFLLFTFLNDRNTALGKAVQDKQKAFIQQKSHSIVEIKADILDTLIKRDGYTIKIFDIEEIDGGVQMYARAWKDGKQLGFGSDGSVDIERFRVFNPPILVPDKTGDIVEDNRTLKHDPKEAIITSLLDTIKLVGKTDTVIEYEKVGNTTDTYYSIDTGDGYLQNDSVVSWNTAWSSGAATATGTKLYIVSSKLGGTWRIMRSEIPFDTSALPDTDTITSAVLSLYQDGNQRFNVDVTTADIVKTTQASTAEVGFEDYGYFGTDVAAELALVSWATSTYNDFTLNATGIGWISKTGNTLLGVRNSRDTDNSAPTGNNNIVAYDASSVGTTQDPKLVIEHSAGTTQTINHPRLSPGAGVNAGSLGNSIFW
jgi:hypothetical protein